MKAITGSHWSARKQRLLIARTVDTFLILDCGCLYQKVQCAQIGAQGIDGREAIRFVTGVETQELKSLQKGGVKLRESLIVIGGYAVIGI